MLSRRRRNPILGLGDVRPGDVDPLEQAVGVRTVPAPVPKAMWQDHKWNGTGYGAFRPKQGEHGTWHWGVDLPNPPTNDVVAPEKATIVQWWKNNTSPNFAGYGPGGVLLKGQSGLFHLLGHLDPSASSWSTGLTFQPGERVGQTAPTGSAGVGGAIPHVHWEVRIEPIDSPSTREGNTLDPLDWSKGVGTTLPLPPKSKGDGWIWLFLLFALGSRRR